MGGESPSSAPRSELRLDGGGGRFAPSAGKPEASRRGGGGRFSGGDDDEVPTGGGSTRCSGEGEVKLEEEAAGDIERVGVKRCIE